MSNQTERPPSVGRGSWTVGRRFLPPARVLWLVLAALGGYDSYCLGGLGLIPLIAVPLIAAVLDLLFQRVRFPRLRVPDAGIATGLFLALLLPPVTPLLLSGTVTLVAVTAKHVLRFRGRPWLNPAASGAIVAAAVFAIVPAWWVAVGPYATFLAPALGLGLLLARVTRWRLPAAFLATYAAFALLQHLLVGATADPRVLLLQALDPTTLFFAFFMVTEPRSAPAEPTSQVVYAVTVGVLAAMAPLAFPTLGLLLALLGGNLLAVLLRWRLRAPSQKTLPSHARPATARASAARHGSPRWSVGHRVAAGLAVVIVLAAVASAGPTAQRPQRPAGASGSNGTTLTGCTHDNPAIPASTLAQLHKMLGPSVIRSYNASSGVVVFYDPVNHVTVTETDLYEDYGYAEFNGDDFAVSGCS